MKIGVLTLPNTLSYGASLQAVALCKVLEKLNCNVVLINYKNAKVYEEWKKRNHENIYSIKEFLKYLVVLNDIKKSKRGFQTFESTVNKYPKNPITTVDQLQTLTENLDAIICGSDQVWNAKITGGDKNFFLEFCGDNILKASYAPSFGYSTLSDLDEKEKIGKLIDKFDFLSVREKAGQDIILDLIGKKAVIVLDPTLLLSRNQWIALSESKFNYGNYILFYSVRDSDSMLLFTKKLSKETGLRVICIGGKYLDKYRKNFKSIRGLGPCEWLSLFNNAKYIVTNSFHGIAFSINLNKYFFVEYLQGSKSTNSRLEQIIGTFNLRERCIVDGANSNINKPINWDNVNEILERERKKSYDYLNSIIGGNIE